MRIKLKFKYIPKQTYIHAYITFVHLIKYVLLNKLKHKIIIKKNFLTIPTTIIYLLYIELDDTVKILKLLQTFA